MIAAKKRRPVYFRPSPGPKPVPVYVESKARVMVCSNEFWSEEATWTRKDGVWVCSDAGPRLAWMRKCDPGKAKLELARLGCRWEWEAVNGWGEVKLKREDFTP